MKPLAKLPGVAGAARQRASHIAEAEQHQLSFAAIVKALAGRVRPPEHHTWGEDTASDDGSGGDGGCNKRPTDEDSYHRGAEESEPCSSSATPSDLRPAALRHLEPRRSRCRRWRQ